MKKKTAQRKAKDLEIGIKQHNSSVANKKGSLAEHVDSINERHEITKDDGIAQPKTR